MYIPFWYLPMQSSLSQIGGNAFGAHFLQLYRKNEYGDLDFLFHDFNRNSASFQWEKKRHKSMFSFLAMLVNCTDWWAINNRLNSVCSMQIKSTLECKIKTRALKGIFLVHKWINNTFESNSVWYHIEEISPFCLVLGCAPFLPKCHK